MTKPTGQAPVLRNLYPDFTDSELASAAEALDRYIDLVARMTERIAADPEAFTKFRALTVADGNRRMKLHPIAASDQ